MKLSDVSIIAWIFENRLKTETGQPIDFKQHPYLYDIYTDWNPRIVAKKAAQIGFTTLAILKSFFAVQKRKLDAIYTLPTSDDMRVLVAGKVNRIITQNPILQEAVKDKDSVEQKQVGENMIYYRGTWGERAAISHSSDLNIHDESSRSKQDIVELYESRLQHSKYQWQWLFSNPSVKGDITDRTFEKSDKREWFISCGNGHEQYLTWPENIDLERACFVCKVCGDQLTDEMRRKGFWRSTQASPEGWHGYHISLLMAPNVGAGKIIEYSRTKSPEQFHNFVLGEPYIGLGNTVSEDLFRRNFTEKPNTQEKVIIGCDSGIKKHYVCGNKQGLFYYGVTEDWEDMARLLMRWKDAVAVIDAMPDITGPRMLRERFKGRVFLNHYSKDKKTLKLIRWGEGNEYGSVLSDRNRLMQLVIDEFADNRIPIEGNESEWQDYISHWLTLFRVDDVDAIGNPTASWETSNGMDHWAHATCYWRIGMDRFGQGGGHVVKAHSVQKVIQAQKPFNTGEFIKATTKPVFWDREID